MRIATPRTDHTSQSLEDKLQALKYFLTGKGIPFVVIKATTSELIGPKKKHLNYLVNMTNEPNVSIPNMVKHLMMRARFPDWSVAFKAIITMHHLMTYGNEKFIQNLASSTVNNRSFDRLCFYADRSTTLGYNMSVFLRRYSRYINNKIQTYRSLGMDFCRIDQAQGMQQQQQQQQQRNNGYQHDYYYYSSTNSYYVSQDESVESINGNPTLMVKRMNLEQLLKIIPVIQNQFDSLMAFDATADDLCNGIINSAFNMLYKDFVKLYIVYQAAIIKLLELYFPNNILRKAREMLELYKKFLVRMDKVSDFLPVVDMVGMDKSDLPNLSRAPELPLKMLEGHMEMLSRKYHGDSSSTAATPILSRMQSAELPRIEYGTLGRPRRRSLRTPTSLARQSSIDLLSPLSINNIKRRQQDEVKRLDRMLEMDTTNDLTSTTNTSVTSNQTTGLLAAPKTNSLYKRKRNCDYHELKTKTTATVKEDQSENQADPYGALVDLFLNISDHNNQTSRNGPQPEVSQDAKQPLKSDEKSSTPALELDWNSKNNSSTTKSSNEKEPTSADLSDETTVLHARLLDSGAVNDDNQQDLLLLED